MTAFFLFFVLPIGLFILILAYVMAEFLKPSKTMEEIVDEVLEERKEQIANQIAEELLKDPAIRFMKEIQWELLRVDPSLTPKQSFSMAKNIYSMHLKEEGIEFGDPKFGWEREDAIELAHAYEIDYWDD